MYRNTFSGLLPDSWSKRYVVVLFPQPIGKSSWKSRPLEYADGTAGPVSIPAGRFAPLMHRTFHDLHGILQNKGGLHTDVSTSHRGKSSRVNKKSSRKKQEETPPVKVLVAGVSRACIIPSQRPVFFPRTRLTFYLQVNGKLGPSIIKHLLAYNFSVTAFTTNPTQTASTYPTIQIITANYTNLSSQTTLLRDQGFDALVILLSRTQDNIQTKLINAAIEAGIPHIVPSCFNLDNRNPLIAGNPIYGPKIAMENYLFARANEGTVTYTAIKTGTFLEWGLSVGTPVNLSGTSPTLLFDGGTTPFSITSVEDIGRAVSQALLLRSDQRVQNQILRIHSTITTQNQLLSLAAEIRPDVEWKTVDVDTARAYASSLEAWERRERDPAVLRGLMPRMVYGLGLGEFVENENEVLGVQSWDLERLRGAVGEVIGRAMGGGQGSAG